MSKVFQIKFIIYLDLQTSDDKIPDLLRVPQAGSTVDQPTEADYGAQPRYRSRPMFRSRYAHASIKDPAKGSFGGHDSPPPVAWNRVGNVGKEPQKAGGYSQRVRRDIRDLGLEPYFDFTPLGCYNQDRAISNWFMFVGRGRVFDYLVYLEYDVYLTKGVSEIYSPYLKYDAAFVNFRKIDSSVSCWKWIKAPIGVKKNFEKWLRSRGYAADLYLCFFPGLIISKSALDAISSVGWPMGFCELRLPTIVNAMGFSCGRPDFPCVRFEGIPRSAVEGNPSHSIFPPQVRSPLGRHTRQSIPSGRCASSGIAAV